MRSNSLKYGVILALAMVAPFVLTSDYHRYLLFLVAVFAILGLSADIIFGGMRQFTFGHQAFFGIGAYTSGKLALSLGVTPLLGFLAAFVFSGVVGLFIGYVCLRRLRALYLAITTFALGAMLYSVALSWHEFTGGRTGLSGLPVPRLFGFEFRTDFSQYYLALALLLLTIYFIYRFWRSRVGRAVIALRENEAVAMSIGVSPTLYYALAFSIASALAGLSGAIYVHSIAVVNPMLLDFQYMLMILIFVLVGGMGTLPGPVIGAIIYVWVSELLRFSEQLRFMVFGIILLICIIFMPRGVYPSLVLLWGRLTNYIKRRIRREAL